MYATLLPIASLLRHADPTSSFIRSLNQEWLSDVQEFLHVGLPKLLFIALYAWVLILIVNFITIRVIKVAEHRDSLGAARGSQVRTLASVIRATGIGIVAFLAFLQIMENVLHFNLGPLLASAGVAGVAIGLENAAEVAQQAELEARILYAAAVPSGPVSRDGGRGASTRVWRRSSSLSSARSTPTPGACSGCT